MAYMVSQRTYVTTVESRLVANQDCHESMSLNLAKFEDEVAVKLKTIETAPIVEAAAKATEAVVSKAYPGDLSDGPAHRDGVARGMVQKANRCST